MKPSTKKLAALKAQVRKHLPKYTIIRTRGRTAQGIARLQFCVMVEQGN